ncbi:MAG TPA: hypothetical protein ENK52_06930 [Saprospiraceae bacterium]|nr:hypothetical protein [Saprospiraceae bacterium]
MENIFRDFLYFRKGERIALVLLVFLSVVLLILPSVFPSTKAIDQNFSNFEKEIAQWKVQKIQAKNITYKKKSKKLNKLFAFNPNTISKDSLLLLGLSKKTINTILNYRNNGGIFYNKEDFKKIYTLDSTNYSRIESLLLFSSNKKNITIDSTQTTSKKISAPPKLFPFNPNEADRETFQKLGLSQRVIKTIFNYRNKGGTFRSKKDFSKIFGLSKEQFESLTPFILLKSIQKNLSPKPQFKAAKLLDSQIEHFKNLEIDINQAQYEDWIKLQGIGPTFAKRILKFREKLGGFYSVQQIAETYQLPDSTFQTIKLHLKTSAILKKININKASVEELKQHPYISWKQAKLMVTYRSQHGDFTTPKDIEKIKIFSNNDIQRLLPYLKI